MIAIVPFGETKGTLKIGNREIKGSSSGLGDIQLGAGLTLSGMNAMTLQEYVQAKPTYTFGVLGRVFTPTGAYSDSKVVNMGSNRWAFLLGFPTVYYVGKSFLDPQLMTFELLPSVTFFTKNNKTYGGGSSQQDPLMKLEGHVTRNVHQAVWLSLDGLYTYGGKVKTDGFGGSDSQSSFGMGGTVGLALSKQISGKLTYGGTVSHNESGGDGHFWRIVGNYAF